MIGTVPELATFWRFEMKPGLKSHFSLLIFLTASISACAAAPVSGNSAGINSSPGLIETSRISVYLDTEQPISPFIYGHNYWCWAPAYGDPIHGTAELAKGLHLNTLRAGGANNDVQQPNDWNEKEVDEYIAYSRTTGAEPLFQVSIRGGDKTEASNWVRYCNITKGYNVKYWIIGNEPDGYDPWGQKPGYGVYDYIRDFTNYVIAMRAVDPTIKIIGPEICMNYAWLEPFLTKCKDYVDIVSFHRYPFGPQDCTVENVLNEREQYRSYVRTVKNAVSAYCEGKPVAITEDNLTWDGTPARNTASANGSTFYPALWLADNLGMAIEEDVWTVDYWSMCEGWFVKFIDDATKKPWPVYYGLQLFTSTFGKYRLSTSGAPEEMSVYASRSAAHNATVLIVLNRSRAVKGLSIDLINTTSIEKSVTNFQQNFDPYSLTALTIPDSTNRIEILTYSKSIADRNLPPQASTKIVE